MKYVYRCYHCDHKFEAEHSIHDNPVVKCEKCESEKTGRILQPTPFILQSGGWFRDGY